MDEHLDAIRAYVAGHARLEPTLLAGSSFAALVAARIGHHELSGPADYLDLLARSPDEVERLVGEIAVPETWLFRYPQSYELLARWLAARRQARPPGARLRMLSVGSATGEEPCSMAITAVHAGWPPHQIDVAALDRSGCSTAKAQRGQFGLRSLRPDMPAWARRWLQIVDRQVDVDPVVADRIVYVQGDVFERLGGARGSDALASARQDGAVGAEESGDTVANLAAPYDVIFCRNLLIYLTRQAGERLLQRLARWLAEDGLLFVGHAELWLAPAEIFTPLAMPHTFALCRAGTGETAAGVPGEATAGGELAASPRPAKLPHQSGPLRPLAQRQAVAEGKPAATPWPTPPGRERLPEREPGTRLDGPLPTLGMTRELADRGELAQALTAAESILARDGPAVELLGLLGSLQLALNQLEPARDSFRKVIYLEPNHTEALLQLALLSQRLGDDEQAARYRHRAERAHQETTTNRNSS